MDKNKDDNVNEFEKEIEELKEWQDNQFNPGYYIGTGRVPKPISSLSKHPVILIVFGLIFAIPLPAAALSGNGLDALGGLLISGAISASLIFGGIVRLIEKKRKYK
jgi:hypothetical protein